jgi:hypothetical protein
MITVAGATYDTLDTLMIVERHDLMKPLFLAPPAIGMRIITETNPPHDSGSTHYDKPFPVFEISINHSSLA